ncbi:MAG: dihydrolipoyl dehydrogenase [Odoribacteraceae bacterium]|jgi:dihydrolipoamide dehydrogenase|nr:dihydrolipoyl dehydrogenase [Odoribacteraceae bacterium]
MSHDIIIIGSGPGGYVAAIRAARLGLKTAVVERAEVGGVCLNRGCIPTKSLLKSAQVLEHGRHAASYGVVAGDVAPDFSAIIARSREVADKMSRGVQYLLKKNDVTLIEGHGRLTAGKQVEVTTPAGEKLLLDAKHVILATGARSRALPGLPQDGERIIGYREALRLERLPASMIVVGSGAIGSELAFFYQTMGTRVTLVEFMPNLLPLEEEEVSKVVARSFKKAGIEVMTKSSVESAVREGDMVKVSIKNRRGEIEVREAEILLSAVGIAPNVEDLGLEAAGVLVENGRVKVDAYYRTSVAGVYAIGDIIPGPALAHVASAEGICCVEHIAGVGAGPVDYSAIPACTYTSPEVASFGLSEAKALEAGRAVNVGKFPLSASGKASTAGETEGFVKLIFDATDDTLLGAHLVGLNVTEMISGLVLAKRLKAKARDIIHSVHPHPTISEAIMEAAAAAHDEAIHI